MSKRTTNTSNDAKVVETVDSSNGGSKRRSSFSISRIDKGRKRSGLELPRKILHSSMSIGVIYTWTSHASVHNILLVSSTALFIIITADLIRFNHKGFEKFYESVLGIFMREEEKETVNGVVYYLLGIVVCLLFLPRDIACLSILILSLCDTSASVVGRTFGKYTPKLPFQPFFGANKSFAGTFGAMIVGYLAARYFWGTAAIFGDENDSSWIPIISNWTGIKSEGWNGRLGSPSSTLGLNSLSLLSGFVAGISEAIDVFGLDDNLTLPILFGFILWAGMKVIG